MSDPLHRITGVSSEHARRVVVSDAFDPQPELRRRLRDVLTLEPDEFRTAVGTLAREFAVPTADRRATTPTAVRELDVSVSGTRERRLVWKAWVLDRAPLAVTLTGPAYHDNPVVYATASFRELTGYPLTAVRGENLRLLQCPATRNEPIETLRSALRNWNATTVELRNERRDGTQFRNRLSIVPVTGPDGTVENWFGIQAAVGD